MYEVLKCLGHLPSYKCIYVATCETDPHAMRSDSPDQPVQSMQYYLEYADDKMMVIFPGNRFRHFMQIVS